MHRSIIAVGSCGDLPGRGTATHVMLGLRLVFAVAAAIVILTIVRPVPSGAASMGKRQCIRTLCKKQKRLCTKAFREHFKDARAECREFKGQYRKDCRRPAKDLFALNKRKCKDASKACRTCCRQSEATACSVAVFGDGICGGMEFPSEQCDGQDDSACPGTCRADCTCAHLDTSFGIGGVVITKIGPGSDHASDLVQQADGKLVVTGTTSDASDPGGAFALARYCSDGSLDATFGTGGRVISRIGDGEHQAVAVDLQPDGKIIVAGSLGGNLAVARYHVSGALDPSFGRLGAVISTHHPAAVDLALEPGGKMVVAGENFLAGYGPTGALDETFGVRGTVDIPSSVTLVGVAASQDGSLMTGGLWLSSLYVVVGRYLPDGTPDETFAPTGDVSHLVSPPPKGFTVAGYFESLTFTAAAAFALRPDGQAFLVSRGDMGRGWFNWHLHRAEQNGDGGNIFSGSGSGQQAIPYEAITFQADGAILTTGCGFANPSTTRFGVARFESDGSPDASFGADGLVVTSLGESGCASAVSVTSDGKIVVAGSAMVDGESYFALVRYLP